jgi:hypothetical protein
MEVGEDGGRREDGGTQVAERMEPKSSIIDIEKCKAFLNTCLSPDLC